MLHVNKMRWLRRVQFVATFSNEIFISTRAWFLTRVEGWLGGWARGVFINSKDTYNDDVGKEGV